MRIFPSLTRPLNRRLVRIHASPVYQFATKHKPLAALLGFFTAFILFLTITLALIQTPQDLRSRAAALGSCDVTDTSIDSAELEAYELVNDHREGIGRSRLRASGLLTKAAQWMANDLAGQDRLSHTDSLGRDPHRRFIDCGVQSSTAEGENALLNTHSNPAQTVQQWLDSSGHKQTLERPQFTQTGIGRARSTSGKWYWVQTFSSGNDGTSPETGPTPLPQTPTDTPQTTTPTATIAPTQSQSTPTQTPPTDGLTPTLIPTTPPGNGPRIDFSFRLPGIGINDTFDENSTPRRPQREVYFAVLTDELDGEEGFTTATYQPSSGRYEGSFVPNEEFLTAENSIWLMLENTLVHIVPVTSLQNETTVPEFTFLSGNVLLDFAIDLGDYNEMLACVRESVRRCQPTVQTFDLNDDGRHSGADFNILMRAMGSEIAVPTLTDYVAPEPFGY